ncbi:MAG TPA: hypothetical protein VNI55_11215, partial [Gaiellaceae bacterium]|nr:hypothetical protein [Gaiellaceae bacterium]
MFLDSALVVNTVNGDWKLEPEHLKRRRVSRDASFVACRLRPPALGSGAQTGQDEVEAMLELSVVIAGDDVWRDLAHAWEALGIDCAHIEAGGGSVRARLQRKADD